MTQKKKTKKVIKAGALGEDLETNRPVIDLETKEPVVDLEPPPGPVRPPVEEKKERPYTWPFDKSKVAGERQELEHASRQINMRYDNPGARSITKVVVYDCRTRKILCNDYTINY